MDEVAPSSQDVAADVAGVVGPATGDVVADRRRAAWFLGGMFEAARHDAGLSARALGVLDAAREQDAGTLFWVVSAFRDHVGLMDARLRGAWLAAWEDLRSRDGNGIEDLDRDAEVVGALLAAAPDAPTVAAPGCSAHAPGPVAGGAPVRVGLVVPPYLSGNSFLQPPLGMMLSATRLRAQGAEVVLLDLRAETMTDAEAARRLAGCAVVVVTTTPYDQVQNYFLDYRYALSVCLVRALTGLLPGAVVCVCGSHATVRPDLVLRDFGVPMVLRGEYDVLVPFLVTALTQGGDLPGSVVTPETVGDAVVDLHRPAPQVLRRPEVPEAFPAMDLVDFSAYYGDGYRDGLPYRRRGWATVLANRGCPWRCDFCFNAWGRRVRRREPGAVVEELARLQDGHEVRAVFFIDFTFTASHEWVHEFCREYRRRGLRVSWVCETRIDAVSPAVLAEMAASGCEGIWFGVESFDAGIVAAANKYRSDEAMLSAIEDTARAGISPHAFIMIGLPGETPATIERTRATVSRLRVPYTKSVIVATPRYGTEYFRAAQEQFPGLRLEDGFSRLLAVRGLVGNEMTPQRVQEAVSMFRDRRAVFAPGPPAL
ncbi:MAG: anaerobic magnesium-protoporphyrin monomethyl ester cyclase [Actinomycetota bacterium]|nr:B12-binding radical protein [Actinomycetota bacterium]MDQ1294673.1 anaerobic magnesium-protoporphyrin monomethyl ester cyclase [Actinomycetota bacterium]